MVSGSLLDSITAAIGPHARFMLSTFESPACRGMDFLTIPPFQS